MQSVCVVEYSCKDVWAIEEPVSENVYENKSGRLSHADVVFQIIPKNADWYWLIEEGTDDHYKTTKK